MVSGCSFKPCSSSSTFFALLKHNSLQETLFVQDGYIHIWKLGLVVGLLTQTNTNIENKAKNNQPNKNQKNHSHSVLIELQICQSSFDKILEMKTYLF